MSEYRKRLRECGIVVLLAALSLAALAEDAARQTVMRWSGQGSGPEDPEATFIAWLTPVELLKQPYESWPETERQAVPKADYDKFWQSVRSRVDSGYTGCSAAPISCFMQKTWPQSGEPVTAVDLANAFPLVLVGVWEKHVPAWDFRLQRIATISYLKVDEVLKSTGAQQPGKVVALSRGWGLAELGETTLCSEGDTERGESRHASLATEGKRAVVIGRFASGNEGFVESGAELVFRIEGDALHYPDIKAFPDVPMSLTAFRHEVGN